MTVDDRLFGKTSTGERVFAFDISNSNGLSMTVITYGATLQSFSMPDKTGSIQELTLGFRELSGYEGEHPYFGATVGRTANRIKNGKFSLLGTEYQLDLNNGKNSLHGGLEGFNRRIWDAYPFVIGKKAGVKLFLESPDGDQGYPGTLQVNLTISLDEDNNLEFSYRAESSKTTIVNLTNHSYWNLSGAGNGTILDHFLELSSSSYLEVDEELIPTGAITPTAGTVFDFTNPKPVGRDIKAAGDTGGYDHCFVLNNVNTQRAGVLFDPASGRQLVLETDSPGVQLYTGNFLEGVKDRSGTLFKHSALCLETEEFPDAVNHDNFPKNILNPGEIYVRNTKMHFEIIK